MNINSKRILVGNPTQAGGKLNHVNTIDAFTASTLGIPVEHLCQFTVADVFAGAGGYSLHRKLVGCPMLYSNDLGNLNHHIIQGLLCNHSIHLDLDRGLNPLKCDTFIRDELSPLIYPKAHATVLDWITSTARSKRYPIEQGLWMVLAMKYAQNVVSFPTTLGPSNRPIVEVIDGLAPLSGLNEKRLRDGTLDRGLQNPHDLLVKLTDKINRTVFAGIGPCIGSQQCAFEFIQHRRADLAYLDPPYPGTLDYERYHYYLEATISGCWPEKPHGKNPFNESIDPFMDLLNLAHHIPIWVCSYGNKLISADGLKDRIQTIAPSRIIAATAWDVVHMPHVSKSTTNQEVLVVAYDPSLLR